jgi:hypothetical protein
MYMNALLDPEDYYPWINEYSGEGFIQPVETEEKDKLELCQLKQAEIKAKIEQAKKEAEMKAKIEQAEKDAEIKKTEQAEKDEHRDKRHKPNDYHIIEKLLEDVCDCWKNLKVKADKKKLFESLYKEGKMKIKDMDEFSLEGSVIRTSDTNYKSLKNSKKWEISKRYGEDDENQIWWVFKRIQIHETSPPILYTSCTTPNNSPTPNNTPTPNNLPTPNNPPPLNNTHTPNNLPTPNNQIQLKIDDSEHGITIQEGRYSFGFARLNPQNGGAILRPENDNQQLVLKVDKVITIGLPCVLNIKSHIVNIKRIPGSNIGTSIQIEFPESENRETIGLNEEFVINRHYFKDHPSYISRTHAKVVSFQGGIKIETLNTVCVISNATCSIHILPDLTYKISSYSIEETFRDYNPSNLNFLVRIESESTTE